MVDASSTTSTGAAAYSEAAIRDAAGGRGEPDWLVARRVEAARAFDALPMPTPQLRPWKYTDVTNLDLTAFPPAVPTVGVDGSPVGDAIPAFAEQALGRMIPATEGKFVAANSALWRNLVAIDLPSGKVHEEPIIVEVDSHEAGPAAIFPRLLINAGERAEGTIVVHLRSGDAPLLVSGVVEIEAAQGANLRILFDDRWGAETQDFTTVRTRVARDADVRIGTLAIGARLFKQTVEALVEGEGAHSEIRGVALGDGDQHFDFVTLQDHIGPRSTSEVQIKSALAGSSKSIYYGLTRVETTAKGSEANQENRNLLLSEHAKADADPVLEILTADVIRCGHGATVGPVDQEALFYLQSRGLNHRTALQLLVAGFFASVVESFAVPGLDQVIYETVTDKIAVAQL
jgi:Fe-S cluster assembly protein SufD